MDQILPFFVVVALLQKIIAIWVIPMHAVLIEEIEYVLFCVRKSFICPPGHKLSRSLGPLLSPPPTEGGEGRAGGPATRESESEAGKRKGTIGRKRGRAADPSSGADSLLSSQ